jgi:hypothetical protein
MRQRMRSTYLPPYESTSKLRHNVLVELLLREALKRVETAPFKRGGTWSVNARRSS